MPEDRKTSINSLIIVWQGQSWSIIAPNGDVLARFKDKRQAFNFAKGNTRHILYPESITHYLDEDFIEFAAELPERVEVFRQSTVAAPAPVPTAVTTKVPADGEFENLPGSTLVLNDPPKRKRMQLQEPLIAALHVGAFVALIIIGALVLIWAVDAVGPIIANHVAATQAAVNTINWILTLSAIAIIVIVSLIIIAILPTLISSLGELVQSCLPIAVLDVGIIMVLFLCRLLLF